MSWETFFSTTIIVIIIISLQWSRFKQQSWKDKIKFFSLLAIGWLLSMFDLANTNGPTDWIEGIFAPVSRLLRLS